MENWTSGYVADVGYTFGYYPELNPNRVKLAFLHNGLRPPKIATACELGFGQGLSTNIHAATSNIDWYGTDFNPSQANFALELAGKAGSSVHLYDESFSDFCNRTDLPDFDYIGLHGIWSWISDENRKQIIAFLQKKLKVGGVLYISYNTLPGWASFAPMRHLMTLHSDIVGALGHGLVDKIEGALKFADNLLDTNPIYLGANPIVKERLKSVTEMNRHYLAHEYFNRDWHPMHFATMAEWLEPVKVDFACSANYLEQIDVVNLTKEQREFIASIPDMRLKQSVRDFMVNQQFRRDYWVKGPNRLSQLEQFELFQEIELVLVVPRDSVSLKVKVAVGEAGLNEDVYAPILDCLSDNKPKSMGQIRQSVEGSGVKFPQVVEASLILVSQGYLEIAQDISRAKNSQTCAQSLNSYLATRARSTGDISFLASPLTGGGVGVNRFEQVFLLAIKQGLKESSEWAQYAWNILKTQGQSILKDGEALKTEDENLKELNRQAEEFNQNKLAILRNLKVSL
jgi:hypothetical protein